MTHAVSCQHDWVMSPAESWKSVSRYRCSLCPWWGYRIWPKVRPGWGRKTVPPILPYRDGVLPTSSASDIYAYFEHEALKEHAKGERARWASENQ